MLRVLLTFFLSTLQLRDGMLGPKMSVKVILTGWPFALRKGAILGEE